MAYYQLGQPRSVASFYEQNFKNEFTLTISQHTIIQMKNSGLFTQIDVEICKFLFEFNFGTAAQIYKYFAAKFPDVNLDGVESFKKRLDLLVQNRVLNKFMLVDQKEKKVVYDDAFQIFCLDLGGKYLLGNYSQCELTNWSTSLNMKSPGLIFKTLDILDFYLNLITTCGKKVMNFRLNPMLRMGKVLSNPDVDMSLTIKGIERHFIVLFISGDDFPHRYKEKAYQLELLLSTKAWSKYYGSDKMPMLLLVADNDSAALEIGKFTDALLQDIPNSSFALSTITRLKQRKLNEAGCLMRLNSGSLQEIKAVAFDPE